MQHHFQRQRRDLQKTQRKQSDQYKKARIQSKFGKSEQQDNSTKARQSYGENASQPDLPPCDLIQLCNEYKADLNVTTQRAQEIEETTRKQADDETGQWMEMRRTRLTASNFHSVITRRKKEVAPLVKTLLYPPTRAIGLNCSTVWQGE